jgi:hypothetical protein
MTYKCFILLQSSVSNYRNFLRIKCWLIGSTFLIEVLCQDQDEYRHGTHFIEKKTTNRSQIIFKKSGWWIYRMFDVTFKWILIISKETSHSTIIDSIRSKYFLKYFRCYSITKKKIRRKKILVVFNCDVFISLLK